MVKFIFTSLVSTIFMIDSEYANANHKLNFNLEYQHNKLYSNSISFQQSFEDESRVLFEIGYSNLESFSSYSPFIGVAYGWPLTSQENVYLNFSGDHFLRESNHRSMAQLGVGISFEPKNGILEGYRFDGGVKRNINNTSLSDELNLYLGVSIPLFDFNKSVQEISDELIDRRYYYFEVDSYNIVDKKSNHEVKFDSDYVYNLDAYYSCSGTIDYNTELSLKRINQVKEVYFNDIENKENFRYQIIHKCTKENDIRVEVIREKLKY